MRPASRSRRLGGLLQRADGSAPCRRRSPQGGGGAGAGAWSRGGPCRADVVGAAPQGRFRAQEIRARARPDQRARFCDQQGRADRGCGGGVGAVLRRDGSGRRLTQRLRTERAPWTFAGRQIRKAPATRSSRNFSDAWKIIAMSGTCGRHRRTTWRWTGPNLLHRVVTQLGTSRRVPSRRQIVSACGRQKRR